jgi:ANTAR domain/GAF domain
MTPEPAPAELADLYTDLGEKLAVLRTSADLFAAVSQLAVTVIPGAEHAGVTQAKGDELSTVAATGEMAIAVDRLQYALREGPCVDAATDSAPLSRTPDLASDARWPRFGPAAVQQTGVHSMMSVQLFSEDDAQRGAALNMYSIDPAAFTHRDAVVATVLASHAALVFTAAADRDRADNLEAALRNARDIGIAIGVLMSQHKISRDNAFDLLRIASQHTHRKLADIARDVADTGILELPG